MERSHEGLNGVPLKSVTIKILAEKSVIGKIQGQKSVISKILTFNYSLNGCI